MRAAALAALSVLLLGCTTSNSSTAAVSSERASSSPVLPIITPPTVTPPTPPGTTPPAFACADASGGAAGSSNVAAVRVSQEVGYDRFVIQFDSTVPAYSVKRQAKPVFTQGPSGLTITLSGTAGVLVVLHTSSAAGSYTGPTDFTQAGFPVLKEARMTEDFEGTVAWGLGLGSAACMRVFTAANPARIIVDFASPTS